MMVVFFVSFEDYSIDYLEDCGKMWRQTGTLMLFFCLFEDQLLDYLEFLGKLWR